MNIVITAKNNPKIKETKALLTSSKERKNSGLFVLEGIRLCCDALKSGCEIKSVFCTEACIEKYSDDTQWDAIGQNELTEIKKYIAPNIIGEIDLPECLRFDLLMNAFSTAKLSGDSRAGTLLGLLYYISKHLTDKKMHIKVVRDKQDELVHMQTDDFTKSSPIEIENLRLKLRDLMKYLVGLITVIFIVVCSTRFFYALDNNKEFSFFNIDYISLIKANISIANYGEKVEVSNKQGNYTSRSGLIRILEMELPDVEKVEEKEIAELESSADKEEEEAQRETVQIKDSYTNKYGSVTVKNLTDIKLTKEILSPDYKVKNKKDII